MASPFPIKNKKQTTHTNLRQSSK